MSTRQLWCGLVSLALVSPNAFGGEARPAVLFVGGVHGDYAAKPLHKMGVELDTCKHGQLAERLATGKFNVVVAGTLNDADRKAAQEFLAQGGGVFLCNPEAWSESRNFTATLGWLAQLGARGRWEIFQETDPKNLAADVMGCRLFWTSDVAAPFNDGVKGVLTLTAGSTTGWEPPMSFDLSPDWKVVVRGAASTKSVPAERHDDYLRPWIPKTGITSAPPLMAVREVGKGRLAVMAIRYYWLFTPPPNCPTAEAMLTAGAGGKPSDWLRVFANAFSWLAEPSLKAGLGGATTPEAVLNPPVTPWEIPKEIDWTKHGPLTDQPQYAGLIGARTALSSGTGTVADYVAAAKAAGLAFIVFLEDTLKSDQAKWDKLVAECAAATDKTFAAIPGLTYEDAQGDHLYAFADEVKFPKPSMVLKDGRLATNRSNRTAAYFDYVNEYMQQHILSGFWRHKENWLHPADYKLYNSFPIVSFEDGKPVDEAFDTYRYFMGLGGCQAPLAFEIMTSPAQVAKRAREGWRVVSFRPPERLRTKWHEQAWSFSGNGAQYITNGPRILAWRAPNCLTFTNGLWWRPDLWEFRLGLRVASDDGLKSVILHDGDRGILRRWLPKGAKTFETEITFSNCQQLGLYLEVEDINGRKAIGDQFWNRNLLCEEFFCSDRCNFLGSCRLRTRQGAQIWTPVGFQGNMGATPSKGLLNISVQPAVSLTFNSPTLPIDGQPMGFPTVALNFSFHPPGELKYLAAFPITDMVGPDGAMARSDYVFGFDPAEEKAEKTPLGHPYEQPQHGWGNSWGGWHRVVPTRLLSGLTSTTVFNWIPGEFRIGIHATCIKPKETIVLGKEGLQVMSANMPGWMLHQGNKVIASPDSADTPSRQAATKRGGRIFPENKILHVCSTGVFSRGTFATLEEKGGSVVLIALDEKLRYRYRKGGHISLHYAPEAGELRAGEMLLYRVGFAGAASGTKTERMLEFARKYGIAEPGTAGYAPNITRGKQFKNYLTWDLDAEGVAIEAQVPKADMPGFLPAFVMNVNANWSAWLLDRKRAVPNFRALPIGDWLAVAQLDLNEGDMDLFIGHPVTCDKKDVKIQVAWQEPGVWFVEAHNPTDEAVKAELRSSPGWTPFAFRETVELAPGTSRIWLAREK
ncbi:MAG: hypothetical protein FJ291_07155 [Planctomycetes bacterium]|nr:hypothetical protein [Planctomycetota bacterium]